MNHYDLELPIDPPIDYRITAGCGHEVYEDETLYEWEDTTLCPDCMAEKFEELSLSEKAELLGCTYSTVSNKRLLHAR